MTEREADRQGIADGMRKVFGAPTDDCAELQALRDRIRAADRADAAARAGRKAS